MKIKIIDLLNKLLNNEEVPKKIKYNNCEYRYDEVYREYLGDDSLFFKPEILFILNDEVEILGDKE